MRYLPVVATQYYRIFVRPSGRNFTDYHKKIVMHLLFTYHHIISFVWILLLSFMISKTSSYFKMNDVKKDYIVTLSCLSKDSGHVLHLAKSMKSDHWWCSGKVLLPKVTLRLFRIWQDAAATLAFRKYIRCPLGWRCIFISMRRFYYFIWKFYV